MAFDPTPKLWILGKPLSKEAILDQAKHGDLVLDPAMLDRTLGVSFVQSMDESGKTMTKKELVRKDITGSGYASVPLEVTRHFADPVAAYLPHLSIKPGGETAPVIRKEDWYSIELDAGSHSDLLKQQTGGRPVNAIRKVTYFVGDYGAGQGYFIFNPETEAEETNMSAWKPLNKQTPDRYLQREIYRKTAADLTRDQQKNADLFQNRFLDYLKSHPGGQVSLRSIPENINNYENEGSMMTSGNLIRVETAAAGSLPNIQVRYTEWVEDAAKKENVPVDHDLTFVPTALSKEGPMGHVQFWFNKEFNWILWPPLWELKKK